MASTLSSSDKEIISINLFRSIDDQSRTRLYKHVDERDITLLDPPCNEFLRRHRDQNNDSIMRPRAPRSSSHRGIDAVHPQKLNMKKQRKHKTSVAALGGMVVGGLTLGPLGIFVGAASAVATNKVCKARERKAQRQYEQNSVQHGAAQSNIHLASFV